VTLLSEERGKLSAFARGARASRRRFGGALEPFTLLRAQLRERRGADMPTLESVDVLSGFGAIRGDLARIACAGYASELARELVRDAEPHPDLFRLLAAYLAQLDAAPARPAALRAFELGALRSAGLQPVLAGCARCGGGALGDAPAPFDPLQGGMLCPACAGSAAAGSARVRPATAAALARLAGLPLERAELPEGTGAEARDLLTRFIESQLGRRLPSRRFLDELGSLLSPRNSV
jgi:DNA repair protein RecO (recombination protein O)